MSRTWTSSWDDGPVENAVEVDDHLVVRVNEGDGRHVLSSLVQSGRAPRDTGRPTGGWYHGSGCVRGLSRIKGPGGSQPTSGPCPLSFSLPLHGLPRHVAPAAADPSNMQRATRVNADRGRRDAVRRQSDAGNRGTRPCKASGARDGHRLGANRSTPGMIAC